MIAEFLASAPMTLSTFLDIHCERHGVGLFKEPFNTWSNLLFIIGGYFLWKKLGKSQVKDTRFLRVLIILMFFVGFGSIVFHMYSTVWSSIVDIVPIAIFAIILIYNFARIPFALSRKQSVLAVSVFALINIVYKHFYPRSMDGEVSLLPSAIILCVLALYMLHKKNSSAVVFLKATAIAILAILSRLADRVMDTSHTCDQYLFGIGTHWLWHSLMAWFMFILIEELILRRLTDVANKEKLLRRLRSNDKGLRLRKRRKRS